MLEVSNFNRKYFKKYQNYYVSGASLAVQYVRAFKSGIEKWTSANFMIRLWCLARYSEYDMIISMPKLHSEFKRWVHVLKFDVERVVYSAYQYHRIENVLITKSWIQKHGTEDMQTSRM